MSVHECTQYDRYSAIQQWLIALAIKEPKKEVSDFIFVARPFHLSQSLSTHSFSIGCKEPKLSVLFAPIPSTRCSTSSYLEPKEEDATQTSHLTREVIRKDEAVPSIDLNAKYAAFLTSYYGSQRSS